MLELVADSDQNFLYDKTDFYFRSEKKQDELEEVSSSFDFLIFPMYAVLYIDKLIILIVLIYRQWRKQ
jgi:hypothetical protein